MSLVTVIATSAQPAATQIGDPRPITVVTVSGGLMGPKGDPGAAGGTYIETVAGEAISALRVVYLDGEEVFHLDPASSNVRAVLGVAANGAGTGDPVNVQRLGVMQDSAWSFTPGPVWCGASGQLTQAPPATGHDLQVGVAVATDKIIIGISDPIELGE